MLGKRRAFEGERPALSEPEVQRLAGQVAPGAQLTDLGGTMSLNVWLRTLRQGQADEADEADEAGEVDRVGGVDGLVLRVHQPFVSRVRLIALQRIRECLANEGLAVAPPLAWRGETLFRCGRGWAELEPFLANERAAPTPEAYVWMFQAMGGLHRALGGCDVAAPRPIVSTYGPPSSLLRWLPATAAAVRHDAGAARTVRWLVELIGRLRSQWIDATELPVQLVHGDVRLSNVRRSPRGGPVYFDFGFLARRPRVHDLAYSLSWMVLRPDGRGRAEEFEWRSVRDLIEAYEEAAGVTLTVAERRALVPYTVAVPLYLAAIAAYVDDPVAHLRDETRLTFLRIAEWLLAHPNGCGPIAGGRGRRVAIAGGRGGD